MTTWYDAHADRYRSSLPHKLFHVWGWFVIRPVLYRLPRETAHRCAIRGLRVVGGIDAAWRCAVFAAVLLAVVGLRLLAFLPGLRWGDKG